MWDAGVIVSRFTLYATMPTGENYFITDIVCNFWDRVKKLFIVYFDLCSFYRKHMPFFLRLKFNICCHNLDMLSILIILTIISLSLFWHPTLLLKLIDQLCELGPLQGLLARTSNICLQGWITPPHQKSFYLCSLSRLHILFLRIFRGDLLIFKYILLH